MRYFFIFLGLIFLYGCIIRTYTIEKPRRDLDIEGNQGYLYGKPPSPPQLKKRRKVTVFEVELGTHPPKEISSLEPEVSIEKEEKIEKKIEEQILEEEGGVVEEEKREEEAPPLKPLKEYKLYTVEKNDTLQKISKKFYGTTKKWPLLYEENKDVIKNPDKIYPGLKIKIPIFK
ncbi:MAG: hypothetical protein B6D55_00070 [Candidatus Omnitrophica bacterium 4484_70.2]|nr:MAG: hypothetical protein B6D55_00070 [Candidatus Omnitrophica bacterium 4484_70.2]